MVIIQTWIGNASPRSKWGLTCWSLLQMYKYERHSTMSILKICLSGLGLQPRWIKTKMQKCMTWEVFLNFMKLLNLQHHVGKSEAGEIDYLYFDDVRPPQLHFCGIGWHCPHTELCLPNPFVLPHYQVCYSLCFNVIGMLVSRFVWRVLVKVVFLQQMSFNYSMP